jgi:plastocyanin
MLKFSSPKANPMKRLLAVTSLSFLLAASLEAAVVKGKVMFLTRRGQRPVVNETLVWLEPGQKAPKRPGSTFTMTTRAKTFLPHVVAVPAGSTISFPNEDPIAHNLFSLTPGYTFDLGLYRQGPGKSHKFDAPGVVTVYCNVHPNMSAVVHVMDTPYYGFADANGNYAFDVPPGDYKVIAWNEQGGSAASGLTVGDDGRVTGTTLLTIDGRNFRNGQHMNKHGKPYRRPRDY